MLLFFLSSGLFLGWSLGANDAANVFGTAVGSKMIRFRTAAIICGIFVILGAVVGGSGTTGTLNTLGGVDSLAGAFMVALSAAVAVFLMTRSKLPVSTSQAIVGSIIGWNLFTGYQTDQDSLVKIVSTWIICPLLAAAFSILLYFAIRSFLKRVKIHLLIRDVYIRFGLIIVGAFGSYSLGANNIANVMGVFVVASPFTDFTVANTITITGIRQLFFIGGIAIAVGVFTYSKKVMQTVGRNLMRLSPITALIVVLSQALVLFLFSSESLECWLISHNLPSIPLVPLSSSQAVIGAILGLGLAKLGKGLKYKILGSISIGWVVTPVIACILTFVSLFFLKNVFNQQVKEPKTFLISDVALLQIEKKGIPTERLKNLEESKFDDVRLLKSELKRKTNLDPQQIWKVIEISEIYNIYVDSLLVRKFSKELHLSGLQANALMGLNGTTYNYKWQFLNELEKQSSEWKYKDLSRQNKYFNKELKSKRELLLIRLKTGNSY